MSQPEARPPEPEEPPPLGAGIDWADPNSPLAPYYLRAGGLAAAALLAAMLFVANLFPLWHTDIWGHLAYGRWIVEHRQLFEREPLSPFTDREAPYPHFQWLSQAGFYLVYRAGESLAGGDAIHRTEGGVEMLRGLFVLIIFVRSVFLLGAYRRASGSLPLACAGFALSAVLLLGNSAIQRPQAVGLACFAAALYALSRPELSRRALFGLPVLFVFWANAHGSFLVGLALLGVFAAGRFVEAAREAGWGLRRAARDRQALRLLAVLVACAAAAGALNPHGFRLYSMALALASHPNIQRLQEWSGLDFEARDAWGFVLTLVLALGSLAVSPRPPSPTQLLVVLSFGVLPLFQQRMMVWWLMLLPWVVLPHWAAVGARLPWGWLRYSSVASFRKTIVAGILLVVAALGWPPLKWALTGRAQPLERSLVHGTPWKVAAELNAPPGSRGRWLPALAEGLARDCPGGRFAGGVYATETLGDYLFWALPAEYPVSATTHAHVFRPDLWANNDLLKSAPPGWGEYLDRHHFNLAVLEPDLFPELAEALRRDPAWRVVLDESGNPAVRDPRMRLFVALRRGGGATQ